MGGELHLRAKNTTKLKRKTKRRSSNYPTFSFEGTAGGARLNNIIKPTNRARARPKKAKRNDTFRQPVSTHRRLPVSCGVCCAFFRDIYVGFYNRTLGYCGGEFCNEAQKKRKKRQKNNQASFDKCYASAQDLLRELSTPDDDDDFDVDVSLPTINRVISDSTVDSFLLACCAGLLLIAAARPV